jgi:hypothetical protein
LQIAKQRASTRRRVCKTLHSHPRCSFPANCPNWS